MENPPWIKKAIFGISSDYFLIVDKGKSHPHEGFVWYEAALQPDTGYLKRLSNAISHVNMTADGSISGRAGDLFWELGGDHAELGYTEREVRFN